MFRPLRIGSAPLLTLTPEPRLAQFTLGHASLSTTSCYLTDHDQHSTLVYVSSGLDLGTFRSGHPAAVLRCLGWENPHGSRVKGHYRDACGLRDRSGMDVLSTGDSLADLELAMHPRGADATFR